MTEWRWIECTNCLGHGLVSAYTLGGEDFDGARECRDCDGTGRQAVSGRDRLAKYPGGPLCGSWPGRFKLAVHVGEAVAP